MLDRANGHDFCCFGFYGIVARLVHTSLMCRMNAGR
jgi:hypothetical protein